MARWHREDLDETQVFTTFSLRLYRVFLCQPMLLLNHRTATVPWERLKSAGHAVDKT